MANGLAIKLPTRLELDPEAEDAVEKWLLWVDTWLTYANLTELDAVAAIGNAAPAPVRTEAYKINLLQHTAGAVFVTIYKKLKADNDTCKAAIEKVTAHLKPNMTKSLAVVRFREMIWYSYETVYAYYNRLFNLASNSCDFGNNLDKEIIQQIISKSNDRALTRDLVRLPDNATQIDSHSSHR